MKTLKRLICSSLLVLTLVSCTSASDKYLQSMALKVYRGDRGSQILVFKENGKYQLYYSGKNTLGPIVDPAKLDKKVLIKAEGKRYQNPKIVEENGKKYLTADGIDWKLEIVEDNVILDVEDNNTYRYVDLYKK